MDNPRKQALFVLASGALLVTTLIAYVSMNTGNRFVLTTTGLYDIPNFVYQRTQMHFPQAEESWLDQAADGKIGDNVKPQHILNKLNDIISDARTHALTENYEARVKAKKLAIEDNYATYDVQKGKVVHKIYGKQIGGSVTLMPSSSPASLSTPVVQQLSQLPANPKSALPRNMPYAVEIPQGLHAGQKFVAKVPPFGKMLVTVPPGAQGGQLVAIQVPMPAATEASKRVTNAKATVTHLGSEHPNAAHMLDKALQAHAREAHAISATTRTSMQRHSLTMRQSPATVHHVASEHPTAANMLDEALAAHYAAAAAITSHGLGQSVASSDDKSAARGVLVAHAGSAHPVAAGMLDAALHSHYSDTPHDVFGLEH